MNGNEKLSPHFTLAEMTRTGVRQYMSDNMADAAFNGRVLSALRALCNDLLEPIRKHFGAPMVIHSGYRMPALNRAVGGQPGSQHQIGEAADFHIVGVELRTVFDWVRLDSDLQFGQLIAEGKPLAWIHVSLGAPFRPANKSQQSLIATPDGKGGMRYQDVS